MSDAIITVLALGGIFYLMYRMHGSGGGCCGGHGSHGGHGDHEGHAHRRDAAEDDRDAETSKVKTKQQGSGCH